MKLICNIKILFETCKEFKENASVNQIRVSICPVFPGTVPFFHIMSRFHGFISNVPLFKCSSVTLNSIDNR
jgi:hypothetical protein